MDIDYKSQMTRAFEILENVNSVTSSKQKAEFLKSGIDNFILKSLLYLTYNPFLMYNIKKIPQFEESDEEEVQSIDTFIKLVHLLSDLSNRVVTGNTASDAVAYFLSQCSVSEQKWYVRVIQKDLKIGLADKGINRVFKDLIPIYEVLLAEKMDAEDLNLDTEKAYKMLPKRIVCQYKIDGFRLNIFVYDSYVCIRTRNGKTVYGYDDLEKEAFEKLPAGYVYDGEMVSLELEDWILNNMKSGMAVTPDRQLFTDAVSHAFSHEKNKKGVFNMFDMVPISEWETNHFTESLEVRYNRIHEMISPIELETIKVVPTTRVFDKDNPDDLKEIVELFHYYISIGWEGIMIKNYDATYAFKRTKDLIKMKLMLSADLEVVDIYEGKKDTKYVGSLGGVYVNYPASDGNTYLVGVGSGWSDEERDLFWKHPELIVGKTIEVSYQSESKNQDGGYSMSFPVKKDIREDK